MNNTNILSVLSLVLFSSAALVVAQPSGRRGPPPEAIEACDGQEEGTSCSFAGRRGDTLSGTCRALHEESTLACVPEGHERRGERGGEDGERGRRGRR